MVERVYRLTAGEENPVAKIVTDENLQYIQMVFAQDKGLPEHFSNANVYMTVARGTLSIALDGQETHTYPAGTLLVIPFHTKMNVRNRNPETLELIVVKAPSPGK